ncbi:MAG: 50S ribosomal protein L21 [Candidatus Bipolaricaulota bacterium]|nr:50S ribosomal protein L21 [Candidatus Bipolaricaulota bacterium]MBS3792222.1 50S ribosomal protein L21 [Candidatus Bipolaricaulota bacterium]
MYAIIETGGKQYRVEPEEELKVEKLKGKGVGETVKFDKVLMVNDEGGVEVGRPYLEDSVVEGEIVENDKEEKVTVFTYKKRKGQRRKLGHRQPYMKVRIDSISS